MGLEEKLAIGGMILGVMATSVYAYKVIDFNEINSLSTQGQIKGAIWTSLIVGAAGAMAGKYLGRVISRHKNYYRE